MPYKLGQIVNVKGTPTRAKIVGIKLFEKQPNRYIKIYTLRSLNTAKWQSGYLMKKDKDFNSGSEHFTKR